MKKMFHSVLSITLILFVCEISYAQTIVGTKHDFSNSSLNAWNTTGEICIVCHTPHNASTLVTDAPLWNHATTATASFALYTSSTFNATAGQPDASSKLCLSCHDGTVALENFGTKTNGTILMSSLSGGINNLGTSLSNDHPISFTYDATLATTDGHLYNPATQASGIGTGTIASSMLIGGKMQCASCHDVHNAYGITAGLLKKSNAASALCLTCHKK